jgi:hypothetical protein
MVDIKRVIDEKPLIKRKEKIIQHEGNRFIMFLHVKFVYADFQITEMCVI